MDAEDILIKGMLFKGAPKEVAPTTKVKTKAKKKAYITGQHFSDSAKMKAGIRERRANRHKNKS